MKVKGFGVLLASNQSENVRNQAVIGQSHSMTKRDYLPLENMASTLNTKQQYNYYCAGWRSFLLNLSCDAPDFTKVKLDEGFAHHKDSVVEKAITRLRKAWYDGYYDARTEARLRNVYKRTGSDLILITAKGSFHDRS